MLTHRETRDGVSTVVHLNGDGQIVTGTEQDCAPIVENVKDLKAHGELGSSDMRHVARVPFVVVEKFCNERGISFREFMISDVEKSAFLNSPDFKLLRVWEGRV